MDITFERIEIIATDGEFFAKIKDEDGESSAVINEEDVEAIVNILFKAFQKGSLIQLNDSLL